MTRNGNKYQIVRYFADDRSPKIIKQNATLIEAQDHCRDPKTSKPGEWFDGYTDKKITE